MLLQKNRRIPCVNGDNGHQFAVVHGVRFEHSVVTERHHEIGSSPVDLLNATDKPLFVAFGS